MATTPNYEIKEDERLDKVELDYQSELQDNQDTYSGMISNSDKYYDDLIKQAEDYKNTQTDLQNQQTQHTIDQINQQKDQAHKDYIKQQSGAYTDWQKQSNQYGTEAEKMASAGLANTGFSESSQVSMYNTYQNRVATARASFDQATLNYNNAIKDAQLQNSSILAQIANDTYQKQLELSLQGFQYKNNLIIEQANKKAEITNNRWNRYLSVLNQINQENALKEDVRQFNENMEFETTQKELDRIHDEKILGLQQTFQAQQDQLERDFTLKRDEINHQYEKDILDAKTKAEKELLDKKHNQALAELDAKLQNDKDLLKYEYEMAKKSAVVNTGQRYTSDGKKIATEKTDTVKQTAKKSTSAETYLNQMIASGATKAQVTKAIDDALKAGAITKEEAAELKKTFTPRGLTY
jgi:hypothetical protein